jgi:hypothetical protein
MCLEKSLPASRFVCGIMFRVSTSASKAGKDFGCAVDENYS